MIKMMEKDRPTFNFLTYLTKVKPHLITKDNVYIDEFNRQMVIELFRLDLVKSFEGTTRLLYTIASHYANLWKFDVAITPKQQRSSSYCNGFFHLSPHSRDYSHNLIWSRPFICRSGIRLFLIRRVIQPWMIDIAFTILRENINFTDEICEYAFKYCQTK